MWWGLWAACVTHLVCESRCDAVDVLSVECWAWHRDVDGLTARVGDAEVELVPMEFAGFGECAYEVYPSFSHRPGFGWRADLPVASCEDPPPITVVVPPGSRVQVETCDVAYEGDIAP